MLGGWALGVFCSQYHHSSFLLLLGDCAKRDNRAVDEATYPFKLDIGKCLLKEKEKIENDQWEQWLKDNFAIPLSTAQECMDVASAWFEKRRKEQAEMEERLRKFREDPIRLMKGKLVDAGFKSLATKLHPDHGGNDQDMRNLYEARESLKREF
jgi:hypothetical protein